MSWMRWWSEAWCLCVPRCGALYEMYHLSRRIRRGNRKDNTQEDWGALQTSQERDTGKAMGRPLSTKAAHLPIVTAVLAIFPSTSSRQQATVIHWPQNHGGTIHEKEEAGSEQWQWLATVGWRVNISVIICARIYALCVCVWVCVCVCMCVSVARSVYFSALYSH